MINPLLTQFDLPPFSSITNTDIEYAVEMVVCYCYEIVEEVLSQSNVYTWETLCYPLQFAENQLKRVWSPVEHLYTVKNTSELSQIYKKSKFIIVEYETWISQHYGLYCAYRSLRNSVYYLNLTKSQKRFVVNMLSKFIFFGCELSVIKRRRCFEIYKALSNLASIYNENVICATNSWKKLILDKDRLCGLSEYDLNSILCKAAIRDGKTAWLLTLQYPVYLLIMKYCEDRVLREEMYWAYNTRSSDQGPDAGRWDNTMIITEVLSLRRELAILLGFNSYFDQVLINRMVKDADRVLSFLKGISVFIYSYAGDFLINLKRFVRQYYGCSKLYPWDMLFYIEKQKKYLFSLSEIDLRYFFSVDNVFCGIFKVLNCMYGINIHERYEIDVWDSNVRFFDIFDMCGQWLGGFYLDIYARDDKFPGAWMDSFVCMMRDIYDVKQRPIAYLVCNFNLFIINHDYISLSHEEVSILFHEFGHVLHHIMTIVDIPSISGVFGVSLDAVEVPSQFMEKLCWDSKVLQMITSHYLTSEPISINYVNRLVKLRRYQSSYDLLYQLIYSIFDVYIHSQFFFSQNCNFLRIFNDIKKQLLIFPSMDWERFPHSFSHIFSCEYAAGYYSYFLSDMLASDIWFYFKEHGILNPQLGKLFLDKILSRGGSEEFSDLFFCFRGREPRMELLLRYYYEV